MVEGDVATDNNYRVNRLQCKKLNMFFSHNLVKLRLFILFLLYFIPDSRPLASVTRSLWSEVSGFCSPKRTNKTRVRA